jgi:SPP1 gp7 family putative phage head morphogenesis protein
MSVVTTVREFFRGKAPPIEQPYKPQPDNAIVSYEPSTFFSGFANGEKWNPDDLVGQKGLSIYSRMLVDEQVKSVTEFKLNAILGRGWQFKFEGKTKLSAEEQKKRIAVFNTVTAKIRGSFLDAIEGVASGREYGYSVTEKVYGQITHDGATFTGLNMLLTRDPGSFKFFVDEYGLIKDIKQVVSGRADVPIDSKKLIHYVHKPKWDMVFGRSELRAAYRAWYLKDVTLKLWALHLERFGSGIPVATRTSDSNVSGPDFEAFKKVMQEFKAHTSIILPPGYTAEVLFPTTTDQFQKALEYHDLAIAKSQLVPNLLGLSHTGSTGAYAQSQTQFEAFFWTTSTDGKRIGECLNEQLFRDLGDQNWGDGDYPYFCFKPMTLENAIKLLTAFKDMIGAGAAMATEDDERFLRELLELPERNEESEPLVDPMAERQQTHSEEQAAVANDLKQQELDQKAKAPAANSDRYAVAPITVTVHNPAPVATAPPVGSPPANAAGREGAAVVPHGMLRASTIEQFTRATQRVAFAVIERRTDDVAENAVPQLARIVAKAVKRALGDDANMAALTDEDPSDVAAIDINGADRGKLKGEFREMLSTAWTLGSQLASNELDRARGERTSIAARRERFASLRDNAVAYFDSQSFRMAGDTSDATRKIIQQELQNGIKFGRTIQEIRIAIWERLVDRGLTTMGAVSGVETEEAIVSALQALGMGDAEDVPAYLNTLVRTNTFEALNEARFAEFTDPAVGDFVMALEYAAVLDSSTTEICRELNGKVYRSDSPEWDEIRPPNHFNCRSVLVPVTTIDGWDGQESERPDVMPAEGFG